MQEKRRNGGRRGRKTRPETGRPTKEIPKPKQEQQTDTQQPRKAKAVQQGKEVDEGGKEPSGRYRKKGVGDQRRETFDPHRDLAADSQHQGVQKPPKNGSERTTGQKRNERTEKTGKSKTQNPPSPDVQTWHAVLPAVFGE